VTHNNWRIYCSRNEPKEVKTGLTYINLRTCTDVERLRKLENILREHGKNSVLVPWLSRPYGNAVGYGIYDAAEARAIQRRAKKECWPDPITGRMYDISLISRRITQCSENEIVTNSR
jgi:hypothetical protein